MQSENKSNVPWSRHVAIFPATTPGKVSSVDVLKGTRRLINKRGTLGNYKDVLAPTDHRRVQSESSIISGNDEEDHRDSQSDPGSTSSNVRKQFSSKYSLTNAEESYGHDYDRSGTAIDTAGKIQPLVRGNNEQNKVRRRRKLKDRVHKNNEVAVEICDQNGSADADPGNHPRYVQSYLDFMRYVCLNPHKWNTKDEQDQHKCLYALGIFQKVRKVE